MTAQELVTKSLESYRKGQAIIEAADKKGGDLKGVITADEHAEINKWFDEADGYKAQADTLARSEKMKKALEEPVRTHPMGELGEDAERKEMEAKAHALGLTIAAPKRPTTFLKGADPRFKYPSRSELSSVEVKGATEAYLRFNHVGMNEAEKKILSPLTGEEGGYLVVDEFRTEIIRKLRNLVYMEDLCTVINTQSAQVSFPTLDIADSQTGIPTYAPNNSISSAELSNLLGKTTFTPHKRAVLVTVPMELIEDAVVDVFSLLTDWFSMRGAEIKETDLLTGNGVNLPIGLLKANGMPKLSIAGSTTNIVPEDIVKTVYGVRAVYRKDASFMMNRTTIQAIRLMRTDIGGAGTGTFMFQPSMQAGEPPTLFGYRLLESEFFTNPYASGAAAGDAMLMFGNLKYYWIVNRIDMQVQRLNELYAANDQIGFRMRVRYDGAPVLADPFLFLTRN